MQLEVQHFSKRFGDLTALSDVSFQVRSGEVLGLIGPNGAGKTTLFECMAGVLPTDSGVLRGQGRDIPALQRSTILFYMPDTIAPWAAQSVGWVLDYAAGFFRGQAGMREEVIRQLGLTTLLRRRIGALSKGQRKRALLAVGLLTPQPILLIDEPFEGLDLLQTREVAGVLRAHAARGRTLFLSIHQISDAARFCDRFVLLSNGEVRGQGTVPELAAHAAQRGAGPLSSDLEEVFLALA